MGRDGSQETSKEPKIVYEQEMVDNGNLDQGGTSENSGARPQYFLMDHMWGIRVQEKSIMTP